MYGPNSDALRTELAALLRHHRIQHLLGGPIGMTPETSTVDERQAMGRQIRRYRKSVLVWCRQAVTTTTRDAQAGGVRNRDRDVAEEFRHRLRATLAATHDGLPTLDEIADPVGNALVDTWRRAARAATLGEHDFGAGIDYGHLTDAQCATVIQDAAAVVRALVSLDQRYGNVPAWDFLASRGRLLIAAEDCALLSVEYDLDDSVDSEGWRPPPRMVPGPLPPGLAGVIQGSRNLLAALNEIPSIRNFRIVLESQRIASAAVAAAAAPTDPSLASVWRERAQTFRSLVVRTRDVAGNLGDGRAAASHAAVLARRVQRLGSDCPTGADTHVLEDLFTQIEGRLADLFARAAHEKIYFLRVPLASLDETKAGLIKQREETFVPLTTSMGHDVVENFRTALRHPSPASKRRTSVPTTRTQLGMALEVAPSGMRPDAISS
ncbi:hypothetical protein AFL01nite_02940 [Aeromicrobium flavum]|uniref:Uncharacterized protein n=1 Tax=Aeromicrobium flavum TaxID=416568 RepID=A0A512HR86_9ACTN|nr:hypothetical protein [Aeromicrobium flavum]GEO87967.1 hypothetical protein AFL01nite_02940 [Aeromicrobium flavum]